MPHQDKSQKCYLDLGINLEWPYVIIPCIIMRSRGSVGRVSSSNLEVVGSSPTKDKTFPHVCAHFGICGRHGIILPRLRLRGQLQYRTALNFTAENVIYCLYFKAVWREKFEAKIFMALLFCQ